MSKWPLHLLHRHYTLQLPFAKVETDFEMPGQLANQEVAHHLEFDSGKKACWQWRPVAAVSRIYDLLRLNTSTQTFCHRMAAVNRNITSLGALAFSEALDDESEEVRRDFQLWRFQD